MASKENLLLQKLEASVTCAVCFDIYVDPRRLQCGHVFCLKCLEMIAKNKKNDSDSDLSGDEYIEIDDDHIEMCSFNCPVCRGEQDVPDEGIYGLEKDRTLHEIIDTIQSMNAESQGAVYGNVVEEEPTSAKCTTHKKKVAFWCKLCQVSICNACILGEHNGHKFSSITDKQANDSAPPPPPIPLGGFKPLKQPESDSEDIYADVQDGYEEPVRGGQGTRQAGLRRGVATHNSNLTGTRRTSGGQGFGIPTEAITGARGRLRSVPKSGSSSTTPQPEAPPKDNIMKAAGGLKATGLRKQLTDPYLLPKAQQTNQNPHVFNQPILRSVSDPATRDEEDIYTDNRAKESGVTFSFGPGMLRKTGNKEKLLGQQESQANRQTVVGGVTSDMPSARPGLNTKKVPPPVKVKTWQKNFQQNTQNEAQRIQQRKVNRRESVKRTRSNKTVTAEYQNNPITRQQESPNKAPTEDRSSRIPELDNILSSGRFQDLTAQLDKVLQNQSPHVERAQMTKGVTKKSSAFSPTAYENIDQLSSALKSNRWMDDMNNYDFDSD